MTKSDGARGGPIQPPKDNRAADLGRAAARSALGAVPLAGSFLSEAADQLLPDPSKNDQKRWEIEITRGVNSLEDRVDLLGSKHETTASFSGGAAAAAQYLAKHCPDGLSQHYVDAETIAESNPDFTVDEIIEGLGELEAFGLAEPADWMGGGNTYRITASGYEALDRPTLG